MQISANVVKELRGKTGVGMMECKKALVEAGGNVADAEKILRKRGLAAAAKKAGRATGEGAVASYIHTGGKIQSHQSLDRLLGRFDDVDESLVDAHLKLLSRFFVHMRRSQHSVHCLLRRQGYGAGYPGPGSPGGTNDFAGGPVQHGMIISL